MQTNILSLFGFLVAVSLGLFIMFLIIFIISSITFWMPEAGWGAHFLITIVLVEFLSGALFPLDILPGGLLAFINLTPFPYLISFPLQVYLGQISGLELLKGIAISLAWSVLLWVFMNAVWQRGLKAYQAYGR